MGAKGCDGTKGTGGGPGDPARRREARRSGTWGVGELHGNGLGGLQVGVLNDGDEVDPQLVNDGLLRLRGLRLGNRIIGRARGGSAILASGEWR